MWGSQGYRSTSFMPCSHTILVQKSASVTKTTTNHPAALDVCNKRSVCTAIVPSHQLSSLLQLNPFSASIPDCCGSVLQGFPAPQPKSAEPPLPLQSRKPAQVSSPQQPLSSRLGPQPTAPRRQSQTPALDQVRAGGTVTGV